MSLQATTNTTVSEAKTGRCALPSCSKPSFAAIAIAIGAVATTFLALTHFKVVPLKFAYALPSAAATGTVTVGGLAYKVYKGKAEGVGSGDKPKNAEADDAEPANQG